jgi:hypothetical protein
MAPQNVENPFSELFPENDYKTFDASVREPDKTDAPGWI